MPPKTPLDLALGFKKKRIDEDGENPVQTSVNPNKAKRVKRWSAPDFDFGTDESSSKAVARAKAQLSSRQVPPNAASFRASSDSPAPKTKPLSHLNMSPILSKTAPKGESSPVASTSLRTLDTIPTFKTNSPIGNEIVHDDKKQIKTHSILATSMKLQHAQAGVLQPAADHLDTSPRKNRRGARPKFGLYRHAEEVLTRQGTDVLLWSQALAKRLTLNVDTDDTKLEGAMRLMLHTFEGAIDAGKSQMNPVLVTASICSEKDDSDAPSGLVLLAPITSAANKTPPKLVLPYNGDVLALYPTVDEIEAACDNGHLLCLFSWTSVNLPPEEGQQSRRALLSNRYALQRPL